MMYKVKVVENIIPPTTAMPIDTLLFAPEPKAKAIGKIPNFHHRGKYRSTGLKNHRSLLHQIIKIE